MAYIISSYQYIDELQNKIRQHEKDIRNEWDEKGRLSKENLKQVVKKVKQIKEQIGEASAKIREGYGLVMVSSADTPFYLNPQKTFPKNYAVKMNNFVKFDRTLDNDYEFLRAYFPKNDKWDSFELLTVNEFLQNIEELSRIYLEEVKYDAENEEDFDKEKALMNNPYSEIIKEAKCEKEKNHLFVLYDNENGNYVFLECDRPDGIIMAINTNLRAKGLLDITGIYDEEIVPEEEESDCPGF